MIKLYIVFVSLPTGGYRSIQMPQNPIIPSRTKTKTSWARQQQTSHSEVFIIQMAMM
jgi:hypothetical protein